MQVSILATKSNVLLLVINLLECLVFGAVGETCPHPEDIGPCVCIHEGAASDISVKCKSEGLSGIENAFRHLQGKRIKEAELSGLKVPRLPSLLFWGLQIEKVTITGCQLQGISDTDWKPAFMGLENSLKVLQILGSIKKPEKLSGLNLAHLKNLKELRLIVNNIPEVDNEWFKDGPVSLTNVALLSCGVQTVGDRAFESLSNLYKLAITGGRFKTLHRTMLPRPAKMFSSLNLWDNNLHSLPTDMFSDMPNLSHVDLEKNLIERLPSDTWSPVWEHLNTVHLAENPLECDSHIEWMFSLKRPSNLKGTCASPDNRKKFDLAKLIDANKNILK